MVVFRFLNGFYNVTIFMFLWQKMQDSGYQCGKYIYCTTRDRHGYRKENSIVLGRKSIVFIEFKWFKASCCFICMVVKRLPTWFWLVRFFTLGVTAMAPPRAVTPLVRNLTNQNQVGKLKCVMSYVLKHCSNIRISVLDKNVRVL